MEHMLKEIKETIRGLNLNEAKDGFVDIATGQPVTFEPVAVQTEWGSAWALAKITGDRESPWHTTDVVPGYVHPYFEKEYAQRLLDSLGLMGFFGEKGEAAMRVLNSVPVDGSELAQSGLDEPYFYRPIKSLSGHFWKCEGICTPENRDWVTEKCQNPKEGDGYLPGVMIAPRYLGDRILKERIEQAQRVDAVPEPAPNGLYIGKTVAVSDGAVIQDVGRGALVRHDAKAFENLPKVGDKMEIRYADRVMTAAKELAQDGHAVGVKVDLGR